ncbi:MAG: hypothetical protein WC364_12115 [Eubacteriales bacterium]|jgi:hypothetical protein
MKKIKEVRSRAPVKVEGSTLIIPWSRNPDGTGVKRFSTPNARFVMSWLSENPERQLRWDATNDSPSVWDEAGKHTTIESVLARPSNPLANRKWTGSSSTGMTKATDRAAIEEAATGTLQDQMEIFLDELSADQSYLDASEPEDVAYKIDSMKQALVDSFGIEPYEATDVLDDWLSMKNPANEEATSGDIEAEYENMSAEGFPDNEIVDHLSKKYGLTISEIKNILMDQLTPKNTNGPAAGSIEARHWNESLRESVEAPIFRLDEDLTKIIGFNRPKTKNDSLRMLESFTNETIREVVSREKNR